ncbi:metallophosphoesterase [Calditerricola satsumensis]|uniref:metallophosphoesterase n=1 Tax=Calditerricola satsumensis TaxID=373054 RepID=UPI0006D0987D|nr:metallophosphoesterase [Calditerricola satsumensis]
MFKKVMLSFLTAFLVLLGYIFWETNRVVVVHDTLAFTDLPAGFDGFRILHITDVHAKTFGENQSRLLAKLKGENVDLIVLTGDYMDRHSEKDQVAPTLDLIKGLRALFPQAPVYFVTGNADVHDQNDRLVSAMQQAGAIFLEGGHPRHPYALKRGNDRIWIGTASYTEEEFKTFGIEKEDFYIVLTHFPWEANIEEKNREARSDMKKRWPVGQILVRSRRSCTSTPISSSPGIPMAGRFVSPSLAPCTPRKSNRRVWILSCTRRNLKRNLLLIN